MHTSLILQLDNFSPLMLTLQNRSEIPFHQNIYSCPQFHSYLTKLCPHVVFLSDHLQLSHFRSGPNPGDWRLLWILLIVQSLGAKILNTLGSQETCQKWRDPFFKKSRPHDSRFLTAPLCSRSGSQSRQNKELAKPANLYLTYIPMLVLYKAQLSATTVAFAQEHVPSQQQESLLPHLNPLPSLLAMGKVLGSPLGSILACCFSHLFPVCCRSGLTSYPSGNEFLLSGNTEEHPFTFFIPLSFSSFHHATLSLDFLL